MGCRLSTVSLHDLVPNCLLRKWHAQVLCGEHGWGLLNGACIAGVTWQRSSCIDSHGCPLLSDAYGAPLTFSGQPSDSSIMGLASMVYRWVWA